MVLKILGKKGARLIFMRTDFRMIKDGVRHLRQFRKVRVNPLIGCFNLFSNMLLHLLYYHMGPR